MKRFAQIFFFFGYFFETVKTHLPNSLHYQVASGNAGTSQQNEAKGALSKYNLMKQAL